MSALRECYMPLAGLGADIPIHVAENGYPTGPGRSYEEQAVALEQMVRAVHDFRGNYNVTDYRWFDLRDGDSSNPNFQQQFGIMRDDYTAKPAFETYRGLIAELACSDRTPPRTTITSARIVRRKLVVTGRSTDEGCSTGVLQALIAAARPTGRGRCRFANGRRGLSRPGRNKERPVRGPKVRSSG